MSNTAVSSNSKQVVDGIHQFFYLLLFRYNPLVLQCIAGSMFSKTIAASFYYYCCLKSKIAFCNDIVMDGKHSRRNQEASGSFNKHFALWFRSSLRNKKHRPVGRAVTRSALEREVWGLNIGPVKSNTVLPTARHRCGISSKGAVLPGCNDAEIGPANLLHASAYYSKYNERFDLIWLLWERNFKLAAN